MRPWGCRWGRELELGFNAGGAGGDVEVEGEDIHGIAAPRDGLAAGAEDEAGEGGDLAAVGMVAGKPLGVEKGEGAGGGNGDDFGDAEDAAGDVGASTERVMAPGQGRSRAGGMESTMAGRRERCSGLGS